MMFSMKDIESGVIFEKYTISEIVDIEKKIRQDIEKKKEDLRIMVGERYRDLIEAADTITKMREGSLQITTSILNIQQLCSNLQKAENNFKHSEPSPTVNVSQIENLKLLNTFIQMLMDVPELIWKGMDDGNYLEASILYLNCRQMNESLQKDEIQAIVQNQFPIVRQQLANLNHIGNTIVNNCINCITTVDKNNQKTCECLCSIILLTGKLLSNVFTEFIQFRIKSINEIFVKKMQCVSIKDQLLKIVLMTVVTLNQLSTIFSASQLGPNNLTKLLQELSNDNSSIKSYCSNNSYIRKDFKLKIAIDETSLSESCLNDGSSTFLNNFEEIISRHIPDLLSHVQTINSLSNIRQDIFQLLSSHKDLNLTHLKSYSNIWTEYLRSHFLQRAKLIIQNAFQNTLSLLTTGVQLMMKEDTKTNKKFVNDCNVHTYIWKESENDIISSQDWVPANQRSKLSVPHMNQLQFKCKAITPAIQNLSQQLEEEVGKMKTDIAFYISDSASSTNAEDMMLQADAVEINNAVRTSCEQFLTSLLELLKKQLSLLQTDISKSVNEETILVDRVLQLCRFASTLIKYNQAVISCINDQDKIDLKKSVKPVAKWQHWALQFEEVINISYGCWREFTVSRVIKKIGASFVLDKSSSSANRTLSLCTQWDVIEIEEENEEGLKHKSTIRVPMQISTPVHEYLFSICKECNRVAAHVMSSTSISKLQQLALQRLLEAYTKFIDECTATEGQTIGQNEALQLLFDVKFASSLLIGGEKKEDMLQPRQLSLNLVERLQQFVDPFDLDVFRPHIDKHLFRSLQRSSILYGMLMASGGLLVHVSAQQGVIGQEQHNILSLSSCQTRFITLPISLQNKFQRNIQEKLF